MKLKADQKSTVKGKTHDPSGRDIRGPPRLTCGYCRSDTKSLLLFYVKEQRPEPASWSHQEHLIGNKTNTPPVPRTSMREKAVALLEEKIEYLSVHRSTGY